MDMVKDDEIHENGKDTAYDDNSRFSFNMMTCENVMYVMK